MTFTDVIRPCANQPTGTRDYLVQTLMEFRKPYRANNPATLGPHKLCNACNWQVFKFEASGTLDTNRISQTHSTYVKLV